jgi:hypothetical protein
MAWKKGQSGNPRGGWKGKRAKSFDDELREAAQRPKHRRKLVEAILAKAESGNTAALRLVAERLGGRPGPASASTTAPDETLSREQVQARLLELINLPEIRQNLERLLKGDHNAKRPAPGSNPAA